MTRTELTTLFQDLYRGIDPFRGRPATGDTCLEEPDVRQLLDGALQQLSDCNNAANLITAGEVLALRDDLRKLGYPGTASQIARVFIGSRTLVDTRLRGLSAYGRYRGVLSRRAILAALETRGLLTDAEDAIPARVEEAEPPESDFFATAAFNHLTASKRKELQREVSDLGIVKPPERLPEYMRRARINYPRSFEPWDRSERALLIEAMCYTNDAADLAGVFGRSASSIRREGLLLIRKSRKGKGDRSSKTADKC